MSLLPLRSRWARDAHCPSTPGRSSATASPIESQLRSRWAGSVHWPSTPAKLSVSPAPIKLLPKLRCVSNGHCPSSPVRLSDVSSCSSMVLSFIQVFQNKYLTTHTYTYYTNECDVCNAFPNKSQNVTQNIYDSEKVHNSMTDWWVCLLTLKHLVSLKSVPKSSWRTQSCAPCNRFFLLTTPECFEKLKETSPKLLNTANQQSCFWQLN